MRDKEMEDLVEPDSKDSDLVLRFFTMRGETSTACDLKEVLHRLKRNLKHDWASRFGTYLSSQDRLDKLLQLPFAFAFLSAQGRRHQERLSQRQFELLIKEMASGKKMSEHEMLAINHQASQLTWEETRSGAGQNLQGFTRELFQFLASGLEAKESIRTAAVEMQHYCVFKTRTDLRSLCRDTLVSLLNEHPDTVECLRKAGWSISLSWDTLAERGYDIRRSVGSLLLADGRFERDHSLLDALAAIFPVNEELLSTWTDALKGEELAQNPDIVHALRKDATLAVVRLAEALATDFPARPR